MENKNPACTAGLFYWYDYSSVPPWDALSDQEDRERPHSPILAYEEDELFLWVGLERPDRSPPSPHTPDLPTPQLQLGDPTTPPSPTQEPTEEVNLSPPSVSENISDAEYPKK